MRLSLRCLSWALPATGVFLLSLAPGSAQESRPSEIKPPFNLTWGETADRLERLVSAAGGKVTARRMARGNREAVEVEGLLQEGLKKTIFYFKQGSLTGVELQYQSDDWAEEKYNTLMGDLRRRISERYGDGQQIARRTEQVGINNVTQTVAGYKWTVNATTMQLVYFSATDSKHAFRTVSVHYTAH
ncbi:MAG: hypothetical protein RLZZ399_2925 [Verrucomicrobiota bacterium]|jgi:hypothetical protein